MRQERDFTSESCKEALARLGERIKRARRAKKLSQGDLEAICRVHRSTLTRLEQGDPGVSLGVFVLVLEALRETGDLELLLSQPEVSNKRKVARPQLDRDF